jgi:hypothetical protein
VHKRKREREREREREKKMRGKNGDGSLGVSERPTLILVACSTHWVEIFTNRVKKVEYLIRIQ